MDSLLLRQGKFSVFKEFKMFCKSNFHLNVQSAFQYRLPSFNVSCWFSTGSLCSDETLSCKISMTIDNGSSFHSLSFAMKKRSRLAGWDNVKKSHGNFYPFLPFFRRVFREKQNFPPDELMVKLTIEFFFSLWTSKQSLWGRLGIPFALLQGGCRKKRFSTAIVFTIIWSLLSSPFWRIKFLFSVTDCEFVNT